VARRSIYDEDLEEDFGDDELDDEGLLPEGFSKQTWAFIVAVLVVLAAVFGTLVYFNVGEGTVQGVTLTPPSRSDDLYTFAYTIQTDRGLATGQAMLIVSRDGETTYTREFNVQPGGGALQLRANDFVAGNGEYTFRLQFEGFEARSNYTIGTPDYTNFVVTSIRVDTGLAYPDAGRIGVLSISVNFFSDQAADIYALSPLNTSVNIRITKNNVQDGPVITQRVDRLPYKNFEVTPTLGFGNYTVNVTYNNNWVRPDSAYQTLYHENRSYIHNKPLACVSPTFYQANNANGYTITTDGSCSSDDNGIAQFAWDFGLGETITNGTSPYETVTFPSTPKTYDCLLTVTDIGVPGVPYSGRDWNVSFQVRVSYL